MDHGLIDRVRGLVGEDARRQARHQLLHPVDPAALHDVVVDQDVLAEKLHLVLEVAEQPSHLQAGSNNQVASEHTQAGGSKHAAAVTSRRQAGVERGKGQISEKIQCALFFFSYFALRTPEQETVKQQTEVGRVKSRNSILSIGY